MLPRLAVIFLTLGAWLFRGSMLLADVSCSLFVVVDRFQSTQESKDNRVWQGGQSLVKKLNLWGEFTLVRSHGRQKATDWGLKLPTFGV